MKNVPHCLDCGAKTSEACYKYCKKCGYKYRKRPSGLKYTLHKKNPTSFKKGNIPWSKGKKGLHLSIKSEFKKGEHHSISTEFKKGENTGSANLKWKGDNVGYFSLHTWIYRKYGKADICEDCKSNKFVQWANIDFEYNRTREGWKKLCKKCHVKYDRAFGWGKASYKYNLYR